MILFALGLLDIAAGVSLALGFFGSMLITALAAFMLLKGAWSLFASIASGFYYDVLGMLDVLAGICLLLGWAAPLLWLFVMAKGFWSIMMDIAS